MKIELRGVLKAYQNTRALDYVSLEFMPGHIVCVLGINGSGKTTLLRCLAGIGGVDKGEILYDGQRFHRGRIDLRSRFYFMPDTPVLFPDRSIIRNISTILRLYNADKEGSEERIVTLLREFDLLPLALRPIYSLSRGQAYKAGLVALLAVDAEVWYLDEPFASGMDPNGIDAFEHYSREAAGRGRTIIYTTQLLDLAERFSNRICMIHRGVIEAYESIESFRAKAQDKEHPLREIFRQYRSSRF